MLQIMKKKKIKKKKIKAIYYNQQKPSKYSFIFLFYVYYFPLRTFLSLSNIITIS